MHFFLSNDDEIHLQRRELTDGARFTDAALSSIHLWSVTALSYAGVLETIPADRGSPRTALQFIRAPTRRVKQPNTTGYVRYKFLLLQQAPELSPRCKEQGSGLETYIPVCRSWCLFSWSERENLRPHSVTSHWYGFSPVIKKKTKTKKLI